MLAAHRDGQCRAAIGQPGQDAGKCNIIRLRTTGPLEGAVVSGDKAALAAFYTQSPPAGAKTPQGETHDPAEEPAFWSSLRHAGLSRFDVKVLEVKNLQPGAKLFV